MDTNHFLSEIDINYIDVKTQLEYQIQIQETKESGCIFDKINSMEFGFYKTSELNGSSNVKIPSRSNGILNEEIFDK